MRNIPFAIGDFGHFTADPVSGKFIVSSNASPLNGKTLVAISPGTLPAAQRVGALTSIRQLFALLYRVLPTISSKVNIHVNTERRRLGHVGRRHQIRGSRFIIKSTTAIGDQTTIPSKRGTRLTEGLTVNLSVSPRI